MRRVSGVFFVLILVVSLSAGPATAASGAPARPGASPAAGVGAAVLSELAAHGAVNVFVMLRGQPTSRDADALRRSTVAAEAHVLGTVPFGVRIRRRLLTVPAFSARVTSVAQLRALAAQPDVSRIDVDAGAGTGTLAHTVPIIGADVLHASGYDGTGITVAVLDSGADNDHPDLVGAVVHEACFGDNFSGTGGFCPNGTTRQVGAGSAEDDAGHGTHVTGIVRSAGTVSSVGVAPKSSIVSIKVTDGCGFGGCFYGFSEITAALDYLVAHPELGVDVVNMSLGTNATFAGNCDNTTSWLMAAAASISNLRAAGVSVVAASGNDSLTNAMSAPGCLSGVLSVAASNTSDAMASFSNTSTTTDVVAPGVNVVSDAIGGGTTTASGTSMASPAVAGCVALIRQALPAATVGRIEAALKSTGTPVTRGSSTFPRINCDKALVALRRPSPPTAVRAVSGTTSTSTGPAIVSFTPGANNGSSITSFTAICVSSNGGVTRTKVAPASPVTFTTLTTAKRYTCTVKGTNAYGPSVASSVSPALVVGSPAPPTHVKSVSGSTTVATGSAKVSFSPGANHGRAITGFTTSCVSSNGGVARAKTGAASPITVTVLTTGKTYTCTVRGTNARGTGLASSASPAVIVGSPAAPTAVTATKLASGQLRVSFAPGANNGNAITGHTAICVSSDGGGSGTTSGAASPLTVPTLTAAKTYTCTVKATNSRGNGLASSASAAVTA